MLPVVESIPPNGSAHVQVAELLLLPFGEEQSRTSVILSLY